MDKLISCSSHAQFCLGVAQHNSSSVKQIKSFITFSWNHLSYNTIHNMETTQIQMLENMSYSKTFGFLKNGSKLFTTNSQFQLTSLI